MLAELMRLYATVSVTGTHGKTTTTSLIAHVFNASGLDPTVITGGIINDWGSNARRGEGPWMIVEADESDGTFIKIPTQIGVVTNIDPEHLDHFKTVDNMHREFEAFFRNIPFYGLAVACIDHPVVSDMIDRLALRRDGRRLLTYGADKTADLVLKSARVDGGKTVFDADLSQRVTGGPRTLRGWTVPLPGHHNALNALAAIAAASEAGIADDVIRTAMASFSGVKRRFQLTGTWNGVAIYDDYGHHPGGDRGGVESRPRRRARPRHRRGGAASLHARARPVRRFRRLLQGCRHASSSRPCTRRENCRSKASTTFPSPRPSARPDIAALRPSTASAISPRC